MLVANHYDGQEAENAKAFGGKPIPTPVFPAPHEMPTSQSTAEAIRSGIGITAEVALVEYLTYTLFAAAAIVPAMIVHYAGIPCMMMLRDPVPYFQASAGWGEIEKHVSLAQGQVIGLSTIVTRAEWEGDGADAFTNYVSNRLSNELSALNGLVSSLKTNTLDVAGAMTAALSSYLVLTGIACVVLETAGADPEPISRQTIGWAAAVGYVGEALTLIFELGGTLAHAASANSSIESALRTLRGWLGDETDKLTVQSAALTPKEMTQIQTWESGGWKNPKLA